MAIQLKRKHGTFTDDDKLQLIQGQPGVDLDTGELYIGECCDGRPINASNLLNARDSSNNPNGGLLQYGGDRAASAGTPATGRVGNTATGTYAIALGKYVHSDARNAITLGYTSVNNSAYGTVIGRGNYSIGDNSVVIGKFNNNNGADNYIIGTFNNINNAQGCYLFGHGLTATKGNNFVIGSNNDSSHNNGHDIFQIGDGWGQAYAGTENEKFNLVTVLKRVRDDQGNYASGGYMEIAIQGNTANSVIKKSTMDTAIGKIYSKDDNGTETGIIIDKIDEVNKKKADKATTLSGYNITDAYTKTEINEKIQIATDEKPGFIGIGYSQNGKNYPVKLDVSNRAYVNVPWSNTTYSNATTTNNGLMSSGDKAKLDTFKTEHKLISATFYIPASNYEGTLYISCINRGYTQTPTSVAQLFNIYYSPNSCCGSLRYSKQDIYVLGFDDKNMTYMESGQVKTAPVPDDVNIVYIESYIITTTSAI